MENNEEYRYLVRLRTMEFDHKKTYEEVLYEARRRLNNCRIESADLDARLLLEYATGLTRTDLIIKAKELISKDEYEAFHHCIEKRLDHEPIAKIIGQKEFYGRSFKTNSNTLDPRADSETLIDAVLSYGLGVFQPKRILDLGTGTGCLLLTLLLELPEAVGVGVDASKQALQVAEENVKTHKLTKRAHLIHSNWFEKVQGRFDLIVSNPPYIKWAEKGFLSPETLSDPESALFASNDGLASYERIAPVIGEYLEDRGLIFLETGHDQAGAVKRIFEEAGLRFMSFHRDLGNRDRVLCFSK